METCEIHEDTRGGGLLLSRGTALRCIVWFTEPSPPRAVTPRGTVGRPCRRWLGTPRTAPTRSSTCTVHRAPCTVHLPCNTLVAQHRQRTLLRAPPTMKRAHRCCYVLSRAPPPL